MDNNTVILDLTGCKYILELHERIKKAFGFPDYYGRNWDAFNDLMRGECAAEKIIIVGAGTMPKEFKGQIDMMCKILEENKQHCAKYGEKLEYEFADKVPHN